MNALAYDLATSAVLLRASIAQGLPSSDEEARELGLLAGKIEHAARVLVEADDKAERALRVRDLALEQAENVKSEAIETVRRWT